MRQIFSFSVCHSPDLTQLFSKSASEELSKWQICGQFGCFCSLTIRVCNKCKIKIHVQRLHAKHSYYD